MRLLFQNMRGVRWSLVLHVWSMAIAFQALRMRPNRPPAARSFLLTCLDLTCLKTVEHALPNVSIVSMEISWGHGIVLALASILLSVPLPSRPSLDIFKARAMYSSCGGRKSKMTGELGCVQSTYIAIHVRWTWRPIFSGATTNLLSSPSPDAERSVRPDHPLRSRSSRNLLNENPSISEMLLGKKLDFAPFSSTKPS